MGAVTLAMCLALAAATPAPVVRPAAWSIQGMNAVGSPQFSPGVGACVSATGTDQRTGTATWVNWNRPYYTERLKQGAGQFRDAALDTAP